MVNACQLIHADVLWGMTALPWLVNTRFHVMRALNVRGTNVYQYQNPYHGWYTGTICHQWNQNQNLSSVAKAIELVDEQLIDQTMTRNPVEPDE